MFNKIFSINMLIMAMTLVLAAESNAGFVETASWKDKS